MDIVLDVKDDFTENVCCLLYILIYLSHHLLDQTMFLMYINIIYNQNPIQMVVHTVNVSNITYLFLIIEVKLL